MGRLFVWVDDSGRAYRAVPELLRICLDFALKEGFTVFELELQFLSKRFINELNRKPFILTPITEDYCIVKTGPRSCTVPIWVVKGLLDRRSAEYLGSKNFSKKFFNKVLAVLLRKSMKNEPKRLFFFKRRDKGKKAWVLLADDCCLQGEMAENQIEKLLRCSKEKGDYSAYFLPKEDHVLISKSDPCIAKGPPPVTFWKGADGKWTKTTDEAIPPLALVFNTARELRKARRLTSIRVTAFTRKKLAELSNGQKAKDLDKAITALLAKEIHRQNKNAQIKRRKFNSIKEAR